MKILVPGSVRHTLAGMLLDCRFSYSITVVQQCSIFLVDEEDERYETHNGTIRSLVFPATKNCFVFSCCL